MAKFKTLEPIGIVKKPTVFTHVLEGNKKVSESEVGPNNYSNILHIGFDYQYGDVFKCWNDNPNDFTITFGVKGDEPYSAYV